MTALRIALLRRRVAAWRALADWAEGHLCRSYDRLVEAEVARG